MDICYIVDTSVSVFPDEWYDLRRFIEDSIKTLDIGPTKSRVGFVSYSSFAVLGADLGSYSTQQEAIDGVWTDIPHLNQSTKTDLGLNTAATACFGGVNDRPDYDNMAILLTDGVSHNDPTVAAAILRGVAKVVAMGIDGADEGQLSTIVNGDASLWFKVPRFSDLAGMLGTFMESSCGRSTGSIICRNNAE